MDCRSTSRAVIGGILLLFSMAWAVPLSASGAGQEFYEVGRLNGGLTKPQTPLNLSTPQSSLESFLKSADDGDFARAAHTMNLSFIPAGEQQVYGRDAAKMLAAVIARKVWIDWSGIPDRPDGLDETATKDDPLAGKPRRSLKLAVLDLHGRDAEIRLDRIKTKDGPPVWLFSSQTVAKVPDLYQAYGPGALEKLLPHYLQEEALASVQWWEIGAIPVFAFLSFLGGYLVSSIWRKLLRLLPSESWTHGVLLSIKTPIVLFFSILIFSLLASFLLVFSSPINSLIDPLLVGGIVINLTWAGIRAIDHAARWVGQHYMGSLNDQGSEEARQLRTNISVARRLLLLIAVLLGTGITLVQLRLFESVGLTLLGTAGVIGIVIGLAAQTVLGNILASMQIAIAKPVRIGDTINYEGEWSYVEEINYTFVLLRTWDERRMVVPVRYFVSKPFENWSLRNANIIIPIVMKLDFETDIAALRKAFEGFLQEDEDWDKRHGAEVSAVNSDEQGVTLRFYVSAIDPDTAWNLHCRMRERLLAYIREEQAGKSFLRDRVVRYEQDAGQHGLSTS